MENNSARADSIFSSQKGLGLFVSFLSLCLLGTSLNLLIIVTLILSRQLKTVASMLLLNLVLTDLATSCLVHPLVLYGLTRHNWSAGQAWCRWVGFLTNTLMTGSALTVTAISVDRYCAIICCLRYNSWSKWKYTCAVLAWIWGQSIISNLYPLAEEKLIDYSTDRYLCSVFWEKDIGYTILFCLLNFVFPCFVLLYCYVRIMLVAKRHVKKIRQIAKQSGGENAPHVSSSGPIAFAVMDPVRRLSMLSSPSASLNKSDSLAVFLNNNATSGTFNHEHARLYAGKTVSRDFKAKIRILGIILVYIFCWGPFVCMNVVSTSNASRSKDEGDTLNIVNTPKITSSVVTLWVALLTPVFNPILYAFLSRHFRYTLKRFFHARVHPEHGVGSRRNSLQSFAAILRRQPSPSLFDDCRMEMDEAHGCQVVSTVSNAGLQLSEYGARGPIFGDSGFGQRLSITEMTSPNFLDVPQFNYNGLLHSPKFKETDTDFVGVESSDRPGSAESKECVAVSSSGSSGNGSAIGVNIDDSISEYLSDNKVNIRIQVELATN